MRQIALPALLLLGLAACAGTTPAGYAPYSGAIRPGGGQSGSATGTPGYAIPASGIPDFGNRGTNGISLSASSASAAPQGGRNPGPPAAQADAFARAFLNSIQAQSFAMHVELCGYFYTDAAGRIAATPPVAGLLASCTQDAPGPQVFASYHTHGAFDYNYDNEVPSVGDLEGDFSFGIDGYLSTPGGRVWRVEYDEARALQVCGLGCVAVDPGFVPRDEGLVRASYTISDLYRR